MAVAEIQDTPYLLSSCTNLLLWQQRRWIRWAGSDPDGTTSSFTNGLSGSRSRMHPRSLTYGPKECRSRGSAACGCCVHGPRSKNSKAKDEAEGKEEAVEEWNRKMWRRL
ncbi:unnamed protein product [Linum tenue]|uniref:Uncharacterized protein n=1 Tax=Linum tenue TaxID=586396 RepID=A0AAV0L375_9ROSI|nr:unnamed protein product [Linum tenue]